MFANAAGTLMVLALVVVVNYDVVARGMFNAPFHGAVELVQFSMVFIVFLQLPDVTRVNRLTRSDGFLTVAGNKWPRVWPEFVEMFETKDYFGVPGVFTAPWWPIKLVIFLSACLCCLLFLLKLFVPSLYARKPTAPSPTREA